MLLAEIQKTKKLFYGTVIAQAQRIDVYADRVVLMRDGRVEDDLPSHQLGRHP